MIQTKIFVTKLSGLNRDMEPKEIKSPSGNAPIKVTKNSFKVCKKPTFKEWITIGSCFKINSMARPAYFTKAACTPYFFAVFSMLPSA